MKKIALLPLAAFMSGCVSTDGPNTAKIEERTVQDDIVVEERIMAGKIYAHNKAASEMSAQNRAASEKQIRQAQEQINRDNRVNTMARDESDFVWNDSSPQGQGQSQAQKDIKAKVKDKMMTEFKASDANFTLYFAYDGADINEEAIQDIIKHAKFMNDNPGVTLRLEGHADERGTREYNLALGENRALGVKELMGLYENLESRITVVSFGEEMPIANTHDESSWGKNRRVEFVYK